jgi:hypothetical protein
MFVLPVANAAIITGDANITLSVGDNGGPVFADWDVDGDTNPDFFFTAFDFEVDDDIEGQSAFRGTTVSGYASNAVFHSLVLNSDFVDALGVGDVVGPGLNTSSNSAFRKAKEKNFVTFAVGEWNDNINETQYFGFQFDIGGNTHYGWAAVSQQLGSADLHVGQFAYEDTPDTPIQIGGAEIPEPSSMALMLLGAAGVATLKLRRKSQVN